MYPGLLTLGTGQRHTKKIICAAVGSHIMKTLLKYYTAWLKAGSPEGGLEIDLGGMVPIARGERVCPPDAPAKTTPATIKSIIVMCEDRVTEAAMQTSRCSSAVVQVPSHCVQVMSLSVRSTLCMSSHVLYPTSDKILHM